MEKPSVNHEKINILVADDNPDDLEIISTILNSAGYNVISACNGEEAIDLAQKHSPLLFILDIVMPGLNGYEACRKLKANKLMAKVPVIFLSAGDTPSDIIKGFGVGAVDYITKPYLKAEVLARAETHIRLYKAMLELEELRKLALDLNPLTQLPGNTAINRSLQNAIDENSNATVIYCDLDNFKAYNDKYGFSAGDRILLFTMETLKTALKNIIVSGDSFLGHIGGDDFVIIVPNERAEAFGRYVCEHFDRGIPSFYCESDKIRGYIESKNRQGVLCRFPFVSVSMAGVDLTKKKYNQYFEVAETCSEVKKKAKEIEGSVLLLDKRQ